MGGWGAARVVTNQTIFWGLIGSKMELNGIKVAKKDNI